jgi:hypothetical protein
MKKLTIIALFICTLLAANAVAQTVPTGNAKQSSFDKAAELVKLAPFSRIQPVEAAKKHVSKADWFQLQPSALAPILTEKPRRLRLELPGGMAIELERADPFTHDFVLRTSAGTSPAYQPGLHYRGYVAGKDREHSLAAVSIFQDEIVAVMATEEDGNMTLGRVGDRKIADNRYVFYKEKDRLQANPSHCGTEEADLPATFDILPQAEKMMINHKLVRVYVELDYTFGSALGVTLFNPAPGVNYVASIFNVMALFYDREGIYTQVSEIYLWLSADPYSATNNFTARDDFSARIDAMGGFNGDLAHLLSNDASGGGAAFGGGAHTIGSVLCDPEVKYRCCYSGTLANTFTFFPTYTNDAYVTIHEMGHNLGSPHTQWCGWPGGPIDNCAPVDDGPCSPGPMPPPTGATIMSYCVPNVNFEHGFGPLPNGRINSYVNAAGCLGTIHLDCTNAPFYPGGPVTASNSGGNVSASQYSCVNWNESGPERTYRVIIDKAQTITATLSGLGADLDVFILDACSESSCLAYGDVTTTTATVPAGEYFIVVDGFQGAVGNFTLTVTTSVEGYCWTNGNSNQEFIAGVSMPGLGIAYTSDNNGGYRNNSTSSFFPIQRSIPTSLTVAPGFAGSASNENWSVWLDINNDQQFQASELRMSAGPSTQAVNGTITLPASDGFTHQECRMRVKMARGVSNNPCGDGYFGETEDYKAIVDDYCIAWPDGGMGYSLQSIVLNGNGLNVNDAGYSNNFNQFFYAVRNGENTFTLTPEHFEGSSAYHNIGWRIYADLNHDNDFNDAGEIVLNLTNTTDVAQTGTFTMPSGNFTGWTRFRITMGNVTGPNACGVFQGAVVDIKVWVGEYCPTSANNSQMWIEDVLLDPATGNASGQDPNGYGDFSAQQFILDRTLTHEIRLYPAFANNTADVTWRVFIDYNHDHDFNDPGEMAADLPGSPTWQIATINIPPDALNGAARMRIQMLWLVASDACGPKVMGEIEDYTVYIDPYCRANPTYNDVSWVHKIAVNDYNYQTGQNEHTYMLYPNYQGRVTTAVDNYLSLYPGGEPNNPVGWRVFIDANQDGDFYDESEMVVELPVAGGDRLNVGFALPAAAITGWTRMRVVMADEVLQGPCDIQFDGEVEDYSIYIDDYCLSHGVFSWERITNVEIGTIANYTPILDPVMGYRDFTAQSTNLTIGEATDYSVAHSVYLYQPDNPSLTIFIDYNRDNDFDDNGERVVTEEASPASPRTGTINVPANVPPGPTRMRITIQQDYVVNHNCDIMYGRGDVSDYTVNLVTGCDVPTNTWAIPSSATAAMLGQEPQSGVNLYGYRYRAQGTNAWTTVTATVPFKSATGLTAGTTYEYQARVRCVNPAGGAGTYTAYSASLLFTMPVGNAPCGQSTAGQVRSITSTGATFQYRYMPNSTRYRVQWRALGAPAWSSWEGTTSSRTVTGLTAFTAYEWQVTTRCGTAWGTPYHMGSFTTLPTLNIGGDEASDDRENAENELEEIAQQKAELVAFPNPFGESVTLQFDSETNGSSTLEVRAMTGQRLMYQDVELVEGLNQLKIFTESWAAGIYYLQLYDEAGLRQVKVVKK